VPFPTFTGPFIVTTWAVFFLGQALGAPRVEPGGALEGVRFIGAVAHGVSQVMFQASLWTAIFFLAGIAISDWKHACWVLLGSIVGMLVGSHHAMVAATALDPESLANRTILDNVALGLYGYNATLAAVALFLWRRSLIPALLGMLFSVPLTELFPHLGLPALTAPFVLATWLVLAFGWLEGRLFRDEPRAVF
jgi:urea transporter